MKRRTLFRFIAAVVSGLVLVCGALAAIIFWSADPLNISAPSDQELIATFHAHRPALEQLRQMTTEDGKSYFSVSNLSPEFDERRKQTYRALISEIYPGLIVTVDDYKIVRFIFASGGLLAIGPGWLKGIEYLPENAKGTETRQNLDKANVLPEGVYLRTIEDGWFIVYQRTE